jgi:hypothetical protein
MDSLLDAIAEQVGLTLTETTRPALMNAAETAYRRWFKPLQAETARKPRDRVESLLAELYVIDGLIQMMQEHERQPGERLM